MADTIFSVATGAGRAAVAVVRVSGPQAAQVVETMTGRVPQPRRADLLTVRHPQTGQPLDRGLVLWFPAPHSFTGENCAELQLHGAAP